MRIVINKMMPCPGDTVNLHGGDHEPAAGEQHRLAQLACGCGTACGVHVHAHGRVRNAAVADDQQKGFWGAPGCSCWAF
jgi:hypothetical protein